MYPSLIIRYERKTANNKNNSDHVKVRLYETLKFRDIGTKSVQFVISFLKKGKEDKKDGQKNYFSSVKRTDFEFFYSPDGSDLNAVKIAEINGISLNSSDISQGKFISRFERELKVSLDNFEIDTDSDAGKYIAAMRAKYLDAREKSRNRMLEYIAAKKAAKKAA